MSRPMRWCHDKSYESELGAEVPQACIADCATINPLTFPLCRMYIPFEQPDHPFNQLLQVYLRTEVNLKTDGTGASAVIDLRSSTSNWSNYLHSSICHLTVRTLRYGAS